MRSLLAFLLLTLQCAQCFQPMGQILRPIQPTQPTQLGSRVSSLSAVQQEEETVIDEEIADEAARLRKEAGIMRLQAEQMDLSLTLQKIEGLEKKLKKKTWLAKHPDQEAELRIQLQRLNDKLTKGPDDKLKLAKPTTSGPASIQTQDIPLKSEVKQPEKRPATNINLDAKAKKKKDLPETPLAGFDDADLVLYIPIADDINNMIPNATIPEKLEAFRTAPELQTHFQAKIQNMLVEPLQEMQRLETLRKEYLDSTSGTEKEQLKRQIDRMESALEEDGPFMYSDGFCCDGLKPLSDEEFTKRMEAVGVLPDMLIAIYKQRNGLGEEDDLSLAIQMDYYEPQLQLLEQVRMMELTGDMREEYVRGFNSLPAPVRQRFAKNSGIDKDSDGASVLEASLMDTIALSPIMQVVEASNTQSSEPPEYNDIEFVDRSRFLEEFLPAIGNMEDQHPSEEDVKLFASEVLNKKSFMRTSKPERVAGGFYIRGTNLFEDNEEGTLTAADKLVADVTKRLEASPLSDKLDFFYVLDPSPPTDEEIEFGQTDRPLFVLTTKNPASLYNWGTPLTKVGTTMAGLLTTFMFSIGACALNPTISDRFYDSLDVASSTDILDLQWLADLCLPTFTALVGIQVAHEMGHRLVAFRDKFEIGMPNVIPSITTGLTGAITPLRSPPPNSKSMFDFAIAGPLAGFTVSIILLLSGLQMTASMGLGSELPVLPVNLLRSSSLGGGLVQFFLGNVAVLPDQGPAAVLQLHPYAIAGFIGMITNALALLPLGHTDGGRISVTMFGRRGAFVVKLFTTLLLCVAGLFGLDETNILLTYVLFASIWQRELEAPPRNEVDELDFPRGLVGIAAALMVGLVLIPMF